MGEEDDPCGAFSVFANLISKDEEFQPSVMGQWLRSVSASNARAVSDVAFPAFARTAVVLGLT
jgi:hypothetical protein